MLPNKTITTFNHFLESSKYYLFEGPHNPLYCTNVFYFHLVTSKFIYFQHEARCCGHLESLGMGSFLPERIFWLIPNEVLTAHAEWLPGVRLRHSVHLCSTQGGLCGPVVVQLLWLSGRALVAQAKCPGFDSQWLPAFSLSSIFVSWHPNSLCCYWAPICRNVGNLCATYILTYRINGLISATG